MNWQPIDTAPKDGTPVLIFEPNAGFAGSPREPYMATAALRPGEFEYSRTDPRLQWYDDRRFAVGYWRPWGGWGNRNSAFVEPTHWMPLPEPPVSP